MKNKIVLLFLLISGWCFGQSVPDTNTFSLTDVTAITGGTSLSQAFANSVDAYFDPIYKEAKDQLSDFRNYTVCPDIGDSYLGGIVAYVYGTSDPGYVSGECHGIIAATADIACNLPWNTTPNQTTGATGSALGTGGSNTSTIVTAHGTSTTYAARSCYELSSGGYTDWVLPSIEEVNRLYLNRVATGGFGTGSYWSSTEIDINNAYSKNFSTGVSNTTDKGGTGCVRAIRYF